MAKNAHLTYDERLTIQSSLADRLSFKAIGLIIGKDPSTIAKEVKGHIKIVETNAYNPCVHSRTCKHNRDVCKPCKKKFGQNCRTCSEDCYKSCIEYSCKQHAEQGFTFPNWNLDFQLSPRRPTWMPFNEK